MQRLWQETFQVPFRNLFTGSICLNLILIIFVLLLQKRLPPQVPLFYGLAEGDEQLTPAWALIMPSVISFSVLIVNGIVASFLKDELVRKALILTGLAATFFSAITTLKIMALVGSF